MSNEKALRVRVSTFINPDVARAMKIYAAGMGWRGLSECLEKAWACYEASLTHRPAPRPTKVQLETDSDEGI